jgi:hypothetical protein
VPLGRNHARPSCTVALGPRSWHRLGPHAQCARPAFKTLARPVLVGPASANAARGTPVRSTLPGARRGMAGGGGANSGDRAPMMVRLPAGHGGGKNSSKELLVDSEEKKSGSAVAFLRRGGATVAGGGPVTVRREGEVSSTLHRRRMARGELE